LAAANNQLQTTTAAGTTIYNNIVAMVNAQKNAAGVLPANFYTILLPTGFYSRQPNSFDITMLPGYKLYQLRTA
jgi:hypothetical protein